MDAILYIFFVTGAIAALAAYLEKHPEEAETFDEIAEKIDKAFTFDFDSKKGR